MPPQLPFDHNISKEEEAALLGAAAREKEERLDRLEGGMFAEDADTKAFYPMKRLSALARSPCGLLAIGGCTMTCVVLLFLVRRSVFFNVMYEALIAEVVNFFKDGLFSFLTYIQDLDMVSGPLLLAVVYALCIVFFIPVTVLNLAAGFCFGVSVGFMSVSFGGIAGASISFLLGRTIARDWIGSRVTSAFDASSLDQMLQRNPESAFKIVCLSRLPPCLPFPCVNYSYALTNVPFWTYFWATWLGLAPGTFAYVYMGSAVRNLADVVSGQHAGGPVYFTVLALGVFGTFAVAIYLMREAQLALGIGQDRGDTTNRSFTGERSRGGSIISMRRSGSSGSPRDASHPSRRRPGGSPTAGLASENGASAGEPPSPQSAAANKKKSLLEAVIPSDAGRELQREGEFILFSGGGSRKARGNQQKRSPRLKSIGRQRTMTRNSSIWNLFKRDNEQTLHVAQFQRRDEAQFQAETQQLEYFL